MAAFLDLCRFIASAGGTADWTYSSTVSPYISPVAAGAVNGRVYKVRAESSDLTQWEVSEGGYSSAGAGSFARTTVLYNSEGTGTLQGGAGTKINFTASPQVWVVASKRDLISIEEANSFTTGQKAQARTNIGAQAELGYTPAAIAQSGSASDLAGGTVPTARLGSGTANATTFLRGDQTYSAPVGGMCAKAWVNSVSAGTITSSFGVSSITKNATGTFTINFNFAAADANSIVAGCGGTTVANTCLEWSGSTTTSTSVRFVSLGSSTLVVDPGPWCAAVFGN